MRTSAAPRTRKQHRTRTEPHPWSDSVAYLLRNSYVLRGMSPQDVGALEPPGAAATTIVKWPFMR